MFYTILIMRGSWQDKLRMVKSNHEDKLIHLLFTNTEVIAKIMSMSMITTTKNRGCKGRTFMSIKVLKVFINLLYTYTMPNNHYCSTYMMPYPHLLAKHCLRVGRKSGFLPDLRHETCLHGAVKV